MSQTKAECPKCEGEILLEEKPELGEIITCGECSAELELMSLDPVKFEDAPETQEDWGE